MCKLLLIRILLTTFTSKTVNGKRKASLQLTETFSFYVKISCQQISEQKYIDAHSGSGANVYPIKISKKFGHKNAIKLKNT